MESFTPVLDLLRGRSGILIQLGHEAVLSPSSVGDGEEDEIQCRTRTAENAARVALLLARSFVSFLSELSENSQEDVLEHISTIRLGDFFASLDQDSAKNGSTPESKNSNGHTDTAFQKITLLGVELMAPTRVSSPRDQLDRQEQRGKPLPKQVLGKLMYSVFSSGESPSHDLFAPSDPKPQNIFDNNDEEYEQKQTSKNFRATYTTLLSRLVESKSFPRSVCRLISDLTDRNADSPFESFEDVIQDLEQMVSCPQIFLHDPFCPSGVPHTPVFGQVYHGRKEEISTMLSITVQMEHPQLNGECQRSGVEAVFISGKGGTGKSQLVHTIENNLSCLGWIVTKAKFDRSTRHASRDIISSLFDKVISALVKMKEGENQADIEYTHRVSKSILQTIGEDGLSRLEVFLPSLPLLVADVRSRSVSPWKEVGDSAISNSILVFALSKILEAVLESDRYIMICCDDLQWADRQSLSLLSELLIHLGTIKHINRHCLFVGLYREDEVSDSHPFSIQYSRLQMNNGVNFSDIKLSGLSKDDIVGILMTEFRMPRRYVMELADLVYKKTAGHAIFVMQFLNSLLNDSIIAYSPVKGRFAWDIIRVELIQTGDSVAELIASNIKSLPVTSQRHLHLLSCFGIQTDNTLLQILEKYQPGLMSSIGSFVEMGILDKAGPIVIFTHDLIQQATHESMTLIERQAMHLDIGTYLGEASLIDDSLSITRGMGQLQVNDRMFYAGRSLMSPLISIACDEINMAGPGAVTDVNDRQKFAEWNLIAGKKSTRLSNFHASFYYYSMGIKFLGGECWCTDPQLCLELHEGAVLASFALGEENNVTLYAEEVIRSVPFEDTLETQRIVLNSLSQSGKQEECQSLGIQILQQVGFDIPKQPTRQSVILAMASANSMASQYSAEQIISLCDRVLDDSATRVVRIMDAFHRSSYALSSPYLPLITCEIVKYSLQFGVCQDATTAFASFGMFKVSLEGDYKAGRYWAEIVRAISIKHKAKKKSRKRMLDFESRAHLLLYVTIDIWFNSPREIAPKLLEYYKDATRTGRTDLAIMSLRIAWRYKLLGGEHLSLIHKGSQERLEEIAELSKAAAKFALLDSLLVLELTGKDDDPFAVFGGSISNIDDLEVNAKSTKSGRLLQHIHVYKMILAFWRGDYLAAEKSSETAFTFPHAKKPEITLIYHTFFRGLVAFRLYRENSGHHRLKEGREMMDKMREWSYGCKEVFENKWQLMKAEYNSSFQGSDDASQFYLASITAARDHGNIHELALAYELAGNYYSARGHTSTSRSCYENAHVCYTQWGAIAIAEKLSQQHNLATAGSPTSNGGKLQSEKPRRSRDWE